MPPEGAVAENSLIAMGVDRNRLPDVFSLSGSISDYQVLQHEPGPAQE
jgi:hypothetical protein